MTPDEVNKMVSNLVADSPIESLESKTLLAEAAAMCRVQLRKIMRLSLQDLQTSDESRTIPGLASSIKRICDTLKVTEPKEDEETGF